MHIPSNFGHRLKPRQPGDLGDLGQPEGLKCRLLNIGVPRRQWLIPSCQWLNCRRPVLIHRHTWEIVDRNRLQNLSQATLNRGLVCD